MEETKVHDLIIIGAGPAALSAAIYTCREDIGTLLLERGVIGGLAAITDQVENYPGFPDGVSGLELADRLRAQAERFGAKIDYGDVTRIEDAGGVKKVFTADDKQHSAHTVLIATGNNYKRLEAEGEKEFYGKGVHYCATCDGPLYKGKRLVAVGGGNSAAQESLFLAKMADHIDILIRKDEWRASDILVERIKQTPNISVHFNSEINKISGEGNFVKKVTVANSKSNQQSEIAADGVFVFIGLVPNTQFLAGSGVELDERGFVKTDKQ
ncbi:MAG TPA: FAD-dependent oxidoreductase, partial [Candidatus Saccharimonadales bacterium]|nr:FAD-dependent oxidoreductase [Candidatus Saccharimonadales bacterium]